VGIDPFDIPRPVAVHRRQPEGHHPQGLQVISLLDHTTQIATPVLAPMPAALIEQAGPALGHVQRGLGQLRGDSHLLTARAQAIANLLGGNVSAGTQRRYLGTRQFTRRSAAPPGPR
jgi:hypothetical protein